MRTPIVLCKLLHAACLSCAVSWLIKLRICSFKLYCRQLAPAVRLAGPTSFAPAIKRACQIVNDSGGQFHILLLIADGQVTRSSDLDPHQLSPQEAATIEALVAASKVPLAVVMVGVGDGPWDMMQHFDDALPTRDFDNFQVGAHIECSLLFSAAHRHQPVCIVFSYAKQPHIQHVICSLERLAGHCKVNPPRLCVCSL